jgi:hypothetical protein
MNEKLTRIKIRLDVPDSTIDYYRFQERWENEGGAIVIKTREDLIPGNKIPFTPGETFRVVSGSIDLVDGHFYYIAEIEKVHEEHPAVT